MSRAEKNSKEAAARATCTCVNKRPVPYKGQHCLEAGSKKAQKEIEARASIQGNTVYISPRYIYVYLQGVYISPRYTYILTNQISIFGLSTV